VLVIGDDEVRSQNVNVKNMVSGESASVEMANISSFIQQSGGM
jgi:histidyl-tRNA synthetase